MSDYGVYPSGMIRLSVETDDGPALAFIPPDPGNRDYAEYLAWCEEGNTADELADPMSAAQEKEGDTK